MINRDVLEAQRGLYESGKAKALDALEKVKADINAFNGAVEACNSLLKILDAFEEAKESPESQEENKE